MKTTKPPQGSVTPSELRHFSSSLPMLLLRAREAVMVQFRSMLREQGLTEQQWRVLRALDASGRSEVSELAHATFLLGPSLSRILLDLEKRDLIATEPHEADQRRKVVQLTRSGAETIDLIAPLSEAIYARISGRLGAKRLSQLQSLLVDIERRLLAEDADPDKNKPDRSRGE
jgi:homoprotocatechuate degradation regulator HpaR